MFPDDKRPARKTTHNPLPEGVSIDLQFVAVAGGTRNPRSVDSLAHRDPQPLGVRIGDSSVVTGDDPRASLGREGRAQIDRCFSNTRAIVEARGVTPGTTSTWVWDCRGDFAFQRAMVESWLEVFGTNGDRPARKTFPLRPRSTAPRSSAAPSEVVYGPTAAAACSNSETGTPPREDGFDALIRSQQDATRRVVCHSDERSDEETPVNDEL
jgi:hypothetical protein